MKDTRGDMVRLIVTLAIVVVFGFSIQSILQSDPEDKQEQERLFWVDPVYSFRVVLENPPGNETLQR